MADTRTFRERGLAYQEGIMPSFKATSGAAISPARLLKFSTGKVIHATPNDLGVVGASGAQAVSAANLDCFVVSGPTILDFESPVTAGQYFKAGGDGQAQVMVDANVAATTIHSTAAGGDFGNQPANDGVTLVSDAAGDTQVATVIGTTTGTDTVVLENITLNGVGAVNTVKVNWGQVLAVKLASAAIGTVTIKETSGGLTITTITAGNSQKGVETDSDWTYNIAPTIVAGGASTKQYGMKGTDSSGATIYDSQALNGTTAVTMNSAFRTVTEYYIGDLAAASAVTVKVGAEEDENRKVGIALETHATAGESVFVRIF